MRECCALVSVRYATTQISIHQIYAKLEVVSYLADVGGIVSMWIGICIISVYDLFEVIADFLYSRKFKN